MRPQTLQRRLALPALIVPLLATLLTGRLAAAGSLTVDSAGENRWIHVRVQETGEDHETVKVNLPFSLLEAILPLLHDEDLKNGRLRLGHHTHIRVDDDDLDAVQLRALWDAVRAAKEGEYVSVEGKRNDARVAKRGSMMIVQSTERDGDRVELKVPIAVVGALFSGKPDELDLMAGVRALGEHGDVQLISVDEDSSRVRIWVDDKNVSD